MIIVLVISLAAAVVTPRLVVVGGGAAGFFGAIRAASLAPSLRVLLLEASPRCLTKVSISGGGRCNVCHDETKEVRQLASGYPRGERAMLGTFTKRFGAKDAAARSLDGDRPVGAGPRLVSRPRRGAQDGG